MLSLVPDAVSVTITTLIDDDELASVQRVERVRDPNPLRCQVGGGCIR